MNKRYSSLYGLLIVCFLMNKTDARTEQKYLAQAARELSGEINTQADNQASFSIKELSPIKLAQKALRKALSITPKSIEPISVRQGTALGSAEEAILAKRQPTIKKTIESLVGRPLKDQDIPRIAIAASGGGDRAMITFLAYLTALEELNVLPACSHVATLSGSTWSLASILAHNRPLSEMKEVFHRHEVETTLLTMDHKAIAKAIVQKFARGQAVSACDFWGGFLADGFFNDLPQDNQKVHLSSLQDAARSGKYPFPLFTSSIAGVTPYEWMEYSPFEIGSDFLKSWIPTEAFGKKFDNGTTTDASPEQTLGFMLGLFGSAYAANIRDVFVNALPIIETEIKNITEKKGLKSDIAQLINSTVVKDIKELTKSAKQRKIIDTARLSPATVPNFTYGLKNSPFASSKKLTLMDGAFAFNLPFPPLLRRNVNLYFVCNAGKNYGPLKKAAEYAQRKGYKFPSIPEGAAPEVSLLYDAADPEVPVIVYIPLFPTFATTKMIYEHEEFNTVFDYMHKTVTQAKLTILKAIRIALNNKRKLIKQQQAAAQIDKSEK
jgi:phospholipase A2